MKLFFCKYFLCILTGQEEYIYYDGIILRSIVNLMKRKY